MKSTFTQLSEKSIYRGRIFELKSVHMRAPNGRRFRHDVVFHPGAAVIVPVLDRNQFVMVRQYRRATNQMILEFPAGTLEAGEPPLTCAKREIVEEVGFQAKRWKKLASFYPAPGVSTELMHLFLASDLVPKEVNLDSDEFLVREIVSFNRLERMVRKGQVVDAKTIIGFYYYCLKVRGMRVKQFSLAPI